MFESRPELSIPNTVIMEKIIRHHDVSFRSFLGKVVERLGNIQYTVIVCKLLAGFNIPNRQLEVVRSGYTVGIKTVIDKSPMIPAQYIIAGVIPECLFVEKCHITLI